MREILFKAKRKNWQELPKEQWWVKGFYFCMVHDDGRHIHHFIMPIGIDLSFGTPIENIQVEIEVDTLCQYTGLTDKNGNMIWENDICNRKEKHPEIVKYHQGDFILDYSYVFGKEVGYNYCNLGFYVCERRVAEVIGNIFDNPELLEGGAV